MFSFSKLPLEVKIAVQVLHGMCYGSDEEQAHFFQKLDNLGNQSLTLCETKLQLDNLRL